MRRMSAIAHFRQLCCLGLDVHAVMPSLLSAVHELIPSETNAFFWADETGQLAGFMPEHVLPEVVATLIDNFDGLVERTLPVSFQATMLRGRAVGNLLPVFDDAFYRGDVYNLVYRPYNMHHAIDGVVRDAPSSKGMGALVLGRSPRQPEFSPIERDTLHQLLPYIAHVMHPRDDGAIANHSNGFVNSGESGLAILDQWGRVAYLTARAQEILYLAADSSGKADQPRADRSGSVTTALHSVFTNLVRISHGRDAAPPVAEYQNSRGRFVFRAHWLDASEPSKEGLVAVSVQQQELLPLVMMRNMHKAGLSERQKQVCLLLAQSQSFESIASQLHITLATAKDYADRIYRKLDVHTREELMQKLR